MHRETLIKTSFLFELNADFDDKIYCFQIQFEWSLESFHHFRDIKMTVSYYAIRTIEFGI